MTRMAQIAEEKILYKDLSYKIVGLAMQVHNDLGFGFLEKVYENSLMVLFEENGILAVQQVPRLAMLINFGKHKLEYERVVL